MYELKFMKCMLLPSNQKIILFSEQRERTEQTEDGGHVTEHKERKHPTEALLWDGCLTKLKVKVDVKVKVKVSAKDLLKQTLSTDT